MSSSGGNASDEKLSNLRAILGSDIPTARLTQVLEASNGSLEHAIEIYFGQMPQQPSEPPAAIPERRSSPTKATPAGDESPSKSSTSHQKIAQHDTSTTNNASKKRNQRPLTSPNTSEKRAGAKQARLDAFFRKPSQSPSKATKAFAKERIEPKSPTTKIPADIVVLDSPPKNTKTLKTNPKPTAVKSKGGNSKQDRQTNVDPASFLTFQRLCETLQELSDTTKRLVKLKSLETLIREIVGHSFESLPTGTSGVSVRARALSAALELVLGGITASPLNVSGSAVSKALQTSLGITRSQISKAYRKNGDIGDCAAMYFQKKTHFVIASHRRLLSVLQVAEGLRTISETDGRDAKQHVLLGLLRACQSKMECRFLVRLLIRNMRIGANIKTILAALAMAIVPEDSCQKGSGNRNSGKNAEANNGTKIDTKDVIILVQKTYDICPSIPKIVSALLEGGLDQMKRECSIQVMTPIAPMLAHPIHSLDEIKNKMRDDGNEATMEWKYDGMRCQAHYNGSDIQLFSRHMLNMTEQFPDVCKLLREALEQKDACTSFVIDAEIVGIEGEGTEARLLPFQDLSTRRKKIDDGNGIRVKVFAFDLMLLNGESLVNKEFFERKKLLNELFMETNNFSLVSSQKLTSYDESKIKTFLSEAVEHGAEGLMVKMLGKGSDVANENLSEAMNSLYEAGTRSHSWLKVKRDYVAGYSDTIDVVPIGAWWGTGRKAQKSFLSPVLLAVYDDEEDVYRSICRCMSFTDAMYESIREFYFNGIAYPSSAETQGAKNEEKEKPNAERDEIESVKDDNSCDSNSGEDEKEEGHLLETENSTSEMDRVNCFPNRPSSAFVVTNESPPIWFKPMEVFEVAFADLSLSRQHTAAAGLVDEEGRGVALRFPRFKRRRPDKNPEQATTSIEIAQLFAKQSKIKNSSRSFQTNRSK